MPLLGGVAKKLIADVDSAITFSPDGKQISFFRGYPEKRESRLVIANADGTQPQELAIRKSPDSYPTLLDAAPAWSPAGAGIACPAAGSDATGRYVTVIEVQAQRGTIVPITSRRWWHVGRIAWLGDGSGLIMVAKERPSDPSQIWHLSYPAGEARQITNDLNDYVGMSLTRENPSALVTVQSDVLSSISIAPDESNAINISISSAGGLPGISWTPDGRIVYAARLKGNQDIYVMDQDGSNQKQLTADGHDNIWPSVSPDGRYVISTVKDESIFVPKPGLEFSQLFFPIKGILCVYDRQTASFRSLPGADNPALVQSNPTWSPDGEFILFTATESYKLKNASGQRKVLLSAEDCSEFLKEGKPFRFDIYRIPFNDGNGGKAEPLQGASLNGMSNFFPRYSPDGKWIVFCKAQNYMLLQPDSELYIIPAEGGQARRLRANTRRMNSWHSFSPNGKWLVFSGKPDSPYTRLYLTHIDAHGDSTPPVVLDHLTSPDRAANIPEFVNADIAAIRQMRQQFIDDVSFVRAAREFLKANDFDGPNANPEKRWRKILRAAMRTTVSALPCSAGRITIRPLRP
jgi:Tol biopolymer transport system component